MTVPLVYTNGSLDLRSQFFNNAVQQRFGFSRGGSNDQFGLSSIYVEPLRDPLIFIYGCLRQTVSTTLDSKCHPMSCHSHRIAIPLMQSQGDQSTAISLP